MELKNGVCIVTGSATGIGAACAIELAKRGCRTVINYTKSEAEAQETARTCEAHGAEALLVRANVAEDADCRRMADAALAKWERIDGLVNNAGTTKVAFNHADLAALSAADFQNVYAVNVIGAFQMIRAVEPAMRKQGGGSGFLDRRSHGRRHFSRLCGLEGRAQHDDAVAGSRAWPADPCQRSLPRLRRNALAAAGRRPRLRSSEGTLRGECSVAEGLHADRYCARGAVAAGRV
jgi:NAD(P)-dependent dehydrogenase (short-subunit alcohol dehydrogenase family)